MPRRACQPSPAWPRPHFVSRRLCLITRKPGSGANSQTPSLRQKRDNTQLERAPHGAYREGEPGDHQVPGRVSHPARTRSRAPAGTRCAHQRQDAGRRQARAARHLAGVPGRRLMPATQPAKSPGTPPGGDDLEAAAAHPRGGGRQPAPPRRATASARRPGNRARVAAPRAGPVSGTDCRRPGSTTGTDPGRGWTAPPPVPETARGKPADRAGKTGRSLASPPAQPVSLLMPVSGPDIPVLCGRRSRGAATEGN
jgi:hypothetical protein